MRTYYLSGKEAVPTDDISLSMSNRSLFITNFSEVSVSTVFLGFDHSFDTNNEPILFETMVFGGIYNEYQVRYHTYDEAELGHKEVCEMISDDPIVVEFTRNQKLRDLLK